VNQRTWRRKLSLLTGIAAVLTASVVAAPVHAQSLYASIAGNITDAQGANIPGATVSLTNENTGLEMSTVTDESGTYTIRNIAGGSYTLKASLQGFKEFVQTGIPLVVGNIVRVNGRLEVGALTESVTVKSEAVLLKTDKADVSVDLRPEDVTNLPLNQYRNYQTLLNLVPGATPTYFQNAQTDTPGRALSTNINGTNRNNNVTRIDGAASINVWLPHHVGYVAPVETIENVNVSTNNFDAAQGMRDRLSSSDSRMRSTRGAAISIRRSSIRACRSSAARLAGRFGGTSCSTSAPGSGTTNATAGSTLTVSRPSACGTGTSAKCSR
jgi:hypothetical protein